MSSKVTHEFPLVHELEPAPNAEDVFVRLCRRPNVLYFDSALRHQQLGRYSFITASPFDNLQLPAGGGDGLANLAAKLDRFRATCQRELPPFQGGAAGLFSYDLCRSLERVPAAWYDEFEVPALAIGLYDVVIAVDHVADRAWIISQGFPETEPALRRRRAADRLQLFLDWLNEPVGAVAEVPSPPQDASASVTREHLSPQFPVDGIEGLTSNFSEETYRQAVRRAIDYICAGDVFQVNLAQRLLHPASDDSVSLYLRLRRRNPATFAAYFDFDRFQVLSASPERFLKVHDGQVETRPIKGTRQRTARPEADLFAADELRQSEKDRAENVMIVDLLRNDLSRVCRPESVRVTQLCELEVYQYVQHLVSAVCGELAPGRTPIDLIRGAFPGGSITGAPKVRAMEIIAEIETAARGPYCGSLGYVGFDGTMDSSILIRTITAGRGWWQMPVGGGIVAQSDPQREYEETWHKATGLLRSLH